ncbi:DOG1 domain-containing protein, partial [Cynara cardunculus var. scolymus]
MIWSSIPDFRVGERSSWRRYRLWRQERNQRSARLERQLKALEDRIDKQLRRFQAQYSRAMNPTQPKDVAELLVPKSTPPLELATLSWLGDWRPSSILGLLSSLIKSSPTLASSLSHAGATEKAISQLIHDLRIEEAVIDEEMTEIQANCILRLPFNLSEDKSSNSTLAQVHSELKKVHRLIIKAQNFRTNALEMVVKKILCQSDAAEFLVAFAGIQETVHQFSKDYKLRKGPVSVSLSSSSEIVGVDSNHPI